MPSQTFWWQNPEVLFQKDTWMLFFPDMESPMSNAMNAIVRFTIYGAIFLFITTGVSRYFIAIPIIMLGTYVVYMWNPPASDATTLRENFQTRKTCTKPTQDNPAMNVQVHEISDNPKRPAACDSTLPEMMNLSNNYIKKLHPYLGSNLEGATSLMNMERTFITAPNTSIPSNLDDVKSFIYEGFAQSSKKHDGFVPRF